MSCAHCELLDFRAVSVVGGKNSVNDVSWAQGMADVR